MTSAAPTKQLPTGQTAEGHEILHFALRKAMRLFNDKLRFAQFIALIVLIVGLGRPVLGDDQHWEDDERGIRYTLDDQSDVEALFVQTQPEEEEATPEPPVSSRSRRQLALEAARRRRSRNYRMPSMFGDFYGGSTLEATIQFPSMQISQTFIDNVGDVNFFVTNSNGGVGLDINPAVAIQVRNGSQTGVIITSSVGPPVFSGAAVALPINDPSAAGFFPPQVPGPGTVVYQGGTAFYAGPNPPGPIENGEGWGIEFSHLFTPDQVQVNLPSGGGAVRRVKIAENNSPIPRDRFIFNYNFFNDVFSGIGDVNRYTVGFEHTLLTDQRNSFEVLFPMASTLDVDQIAGGQRSTDTEFGDLTLIYKHLLWERDDCLISAGLGLTVPTGDNARIFSSTGQKIVELEHDSTHILPFVAMLHSYDSGWYWQAFMQLDIDTNGNPISADMSGANLQHVGVLQDQTLMFFDVGGGYWLRDPGQGTPAVAATAELHWASTLQNADVVNAAGLNITSAINRYDVLNLTLGASILVNESFTVRPAMVIPLSDGDGEQFDYEAMVQMNFWR